MATKQSEKGLWSASIYVSAGGPQAQADGVISYPIPLELKTGETYNVVYENETQVEKAGSVVGCKGNANGPIAEPGYLCIFQGTVGTVGSTKKDWKNAAFFDLQEASGVQNLTAEQAEKGKSGLSKSINGEVVVYRTSEFNEEAPGTTQTAASSLNAAGSWAVTAK